MSQTPSDTTTAAAPVEPRAERVGEAVKQWQRHLVDLGGRNSLLWYRDLRSGTLDLTNAHPGGIAMLLAGRPTKLSHLVREPAALEEARRRARTVRAKTLELREERGITAGFIAVGMAAWRVNGASRPPAAPVLLRSCVLRPTGAAQQDFDIDLGPDVELNPVLEQYLRSEQGIVLDADALEEMATVGGGFDPHPVFSALAQACRGVQSFEIAPRLVVGTFSYAKLPMVADLAAQLETLADHDVVAALAGDPSALKAVRTTVPTFAPDSDPGREHLVLDADSSQQAVIDAVRSGSNLVIKGPPGTGKSQTIANLIASLAADGKRTLFVAEKRAAIDAVVGRLDRLGLADLVLDVYDGVANKRRVAQELGAALERTTEAAEPDTVQNDRTLLDRRDRLVAHTTALHTVRDPWGVSAFDAQVALSELSSHRPAPGSRVRLHGDTLAGLTRDRVEWLAQALADAASLGAWLTGEDEDPWYAARVTSSDEAARALEVASRWSSAEMAATAGRLDAVVEEVGLPAARRAADWREALDLVASVQSTLDVFRPEVFDVPLTDLVAATGDSAFRRRAGITQGWFSRWRLRRQARSLLRPGRPPADLHGALTQAQELRVRWGHLAGGGGRPRVPSGLGEAQATFAELDSDLQWLGSRLEQTPLGGDLFATPLPELRDRLELLAARPDRLAVVPRVVGLLDAQRAAGLGSLVDDLAARGVAAPDVAREVEFVWWASLLDTVTVRDPAYGAHDGEFLRTVAGEYIAADHRHLDATVERVRAASGRRLRTVLAEHPDQEALVRHEAGKSRRHRPMREMLPRAGDVLTAIKPCWAMSPLVVASLLPAGRWFDVVIFDEASQIPPAQAVSAISRASQVVVAGDERQLPPTSFFTAATEDEEVTESLTEGAESVLDVLAAALPMRRLTWHYRSLDERLVTFANEQMYDGSLVTFPGTGGEAVVRLELVDGSAPVEAGQDAIETTQAEVDRVVQLVLAHARSRPTESLGVIALGIRHAQRIEDALRSALLHAPELGAFFDEEADERFFVKNLERVQGDERDHIILSIGYGKTPHGRVLHRFGPLNLEGGERRLNVAITRARRRMTVVSSLSAADLDPGKLRARGARMLRDFLAYAAVEGSVVPPRTEAPLATRDEAVEIDDADGADSAGATQDRADVGSNGEESDGPQADLAADAPGVSDASDGPAADDQTRPGEPPAAASAPAAPAAPAGPAAEAASGTGRSDPLVADLARRLRAEGLVVHERFGISAHRLDLAVEDPHRPGRVRVAVETDGRAYAAMSSTRDRDRLRVEQLGRLGWEHVRVWTTDLFRDPARDAARVVKAVRESASAQSAAGGGSPPPPVMVAPAADVPEADVPEERSVQDRGTGGGGRSAEAAQEGSVPPARAAELVEASSTPAPVGSLDRSKDDSDVGWGELPKSGDADAEWLRQQRPPHWG